MKQKSLETLQGLFQFENSAAELYSVQAKMKLRDVSIDEDYYRSSYRLTSTTV